MKKIMFLIVGLFLLSMITSKVTFSYTKEAYVHVHVDIGEGTKRWDGNLKCCNQNDTYNCKIVKLEVPNSIVGVEEDPNGNGWTISGNIESVDLQRLVDNNWIEVPRDGKNYPFSNAETLVIDQCADFPELVGRIIPLDGISTDNNGDFEVFVPNNNQ